MANQQNIDIFQGTNRTLNLGARDASNNPVNLTGLTITWLVGFPPFVPWLSQAVITKAGAIANAAQGLFTVAMIPSDTQCLEGGNYAHQAITIDNNGNRAIVTEGQFRLRSIVERMQ